MIGPTALVAAAIGAAVDTTLLEVSPSKLNKTERGERIRCRLERIERDYRVLGTTILVLGVLGLGAFCLRAANTAPVVTVSAILFAILTIVSAQGVGGRRPESVLLAFDPILGVLRRVLRYPLLIVVHRLTDLILNRFSGPEPESDEEDPNEELLTAVRDTLPEADLDEDESYWIGNIVALAHRTARAAMTPRTDVIAFESSLSLRDALAQAVDHGYSRYPVFESTIDRVLGVFYAKDLLEMVDSGQPIGDEEVRPLVREPVFVDDTEGLAEVLQMFRRSKRHMAIVRDQYGGTCGVITVEDILEEIVGDIEDEYDAVGHGTVRVLEEGCALEVDGRARIDEVNEHLAQRLPEGDDYETVAGWVFTSLERIPEKGEEFELGPARLEILDADAQRIRRLTLRIRGTDDRSPTAVLTPKSEA
ncbi:MAG: hemolysin family protein [Planctomycetota bacterium]